jgi:hypothetical protein
MSSNVQGVLAAPVIRIEADTDVACLTPGIERTTR